MKSKAHALSPRWPFWLLIAAWVCANSPQAATYAFLSWMAEARSFTHQQRLTADVARLLGGEREETQVAARENSPPPASLPAVPAEAVLKKIPLSVERTADVLPPALGASHPRVAAWLCPDVWRAPPPHGPPRVDLG